MKLLGGGGELTGWGKNGPAYFFRGERMGRKLTGGIFRPVTPGWFMLFVVLCPGTPEGSTGSGSGFKASQKTGQRLKVSSDRLGEAGNGTCNPWFTRQRFIPYTKAPSQHPNVWWPISVMHI